MLGEAYVMDKGKAIESALLQIEKKFGKGAIMRLGERPHQEIGAISTQCLSLDAAIGVGGFPRGRIVEVYGPESSGKTTLALTVVASAQKTGGVSRCACAPARPQLAAGGEGGRGAVPGVPCS